MPRQGSRCGHQHHLLVGKIPLPLSLVRSVNGGVGRRLPHRPRLGSGTATHRVAASSPWGFFFLCKGNAWTGGAGRMACRSKILGVPHAAGGWHCGREHLLVWQHSPRIRVPGRVQGQRKELPLARQANDAGQLRCLRHLHACRPRKRPPRAELETRVKLANPSEGRWGRKVGHEQHALAQRQASPNSVRRKVLHKALCLPGRRALRVKEVVSTFVCINRVPKSLGSGGAQPGWPAQIHATLGAPRAWQSRRSWPTCLHVLRPYNTRQIMRSAQTGTWCRGVEASNRQVRSVRGGNSRASTPAPHTLPRLLCTLACLAYTLQGAKCVGAPLLWHKQRVHAAC